MNYLRSFVIVCLVALLGLPVMAAEPTAGTAAGAAATASVALPVNINTADAATLAAAITGVGENKAEAIVAYRTEHGAFGSVDELTKVKGIGPKTVDMNRDRITVGK